MVQDDLINKNMQISKKKKCLIFYNALETFFNNAETFERQDLNE